MRLGVAEVNKLLNHLPERESKFTALAERPPNDIFGQRPKREPRVRLGSAIRYTPKAGIILQEASDPGIGGPRLLLLIFPKPRQLIHVSPMPGGLAMAVLLYHAVGILRIVLSRACPHVESKE